MHVEAVELRAAAAEGGRASLEEELQRLRDLVDAMHGRYAREQYQRGHIRRTRHALSNSKHVIGSARASTMSPEDSGTRLPDGVKELRDYEVG